MQLQDALARTNVQLFDELPVEHDQCVASCCRSLERGDNTSRMLDLCFRRCKRGIGNFKRAWVDERFAVEAKRSALRAGALKPRRVADVKMDPVEHCLAIGACGKDDLG